MLDMPSSLDEFFGMQDNSAEQNRIAMSRGFSLLEEALLLTAKTLSFLWTDPLNKRIAAKHSEVPHVQTVQLNLAYATWATVVNACRLLRFGAFVNVLSLLRDALESYSYFWYLSREPSDVAEWVDRINPEEISRDIGDRITFDEMRIAFDKFRRKVKKRFEKQNSPEIDYRGQYYVLSTLGTHTNPLSLSGSLPSESREGNFGFFSVGEDENLRCFAHDTLQLVMALLEELYGQFGNYIPRSCTYMGKVTGRNRRGNEVAIYEPISLALPRRYTKLKKDFRSYEADFDSELRLI